MTEIYGHKWVSAYGDCVDDDGELSDVANTWMIGLREVTPEQFSASLNLCITSGSAWPPTLPEFRDMCLGKNENEFGLTFSPEVYRKQPERSRDRLLSSDARDEKRKRLKRGIGDLRDSLQKYKSNINSGEVALPEFVSDPVKRREIEEKLKSMDLLPGGKT